LIPGPSVWPLCLLVLLLLSAGCRGPEVTPEASSSPSPDPVQAVLAQADRHLLSQEFEEAAVLFREALDSLDSAQAGEAELAAVRERCTQAMVEAGGFVASKRLWTEIALKNPDSKMEAERMVKRAERMMLMQADELYLQAQDDFKENHRSKGLSTVQAADVLYRMAGGSKEQLKAAQECIEANAD